MGNVSTTVEPYNRVSDVDVVMNTIRPKYKQGLGNMLILNLINSAPAASTSAEGDKSADENVEVPATAPISEDSVSVSEKLAGLLLRKVDKNTGAVYREYSNLSALEKDYPKNSDVWRKANAYFAQDNRSDRLAVLNLDSSKVQDSLSAFWYFNWTFAVLAKNPDLDALKAISNIFEANKDHFLLVQSSNLDDFQTLEGQAYTIGIYHLEDDEAIDAAWLGDVANLTVGSVTWKFRNLKGITPDVLTSAELKSLETLHLQGYTTVYGHDQTTEGRTLSGEYIDLLHGVLWVQNEMQNKLEKLLQDNGKIPYEQRGINMILAVGTTVLEAATEQGIILTDSVTGKGDYTITATARADQSKEDLSKRHYGGLSFTYHASGAIHSITVHGTVNSDTIMDAA